MRLVIEQQNIAVVGYGVTGKACVDFLLHKGALVTLLNDKLPEQLPAGINFEIFDANSSIDDFDFVAVSPGINPLSPMFTAYRNAGGQLISDIELFALFNNTPTIGITGSNGKTTVTEMLVHVLKTCGMDAGVGGNVGNSALQLLDQDFDVIVLELSSFQLQLTQHLALQHAVLLNLTEDHLDRHGDMHNYLECKRQIFNQAKSVVCIDGITESVPPASFATQSQTQIYMQRPTRDDDLTSNGINSALRNVLYYDENTHSIWLNNKHFVDCKKLQLQGMHNVLNTMVVAAIAVDYISSTNNIKQAIYQFSGLPHRSQIVKTGITTWINDSKATNVGATVAALSQFTQTQQFVVLIAGGDAKGASIAPLQKYLGRTVQAVVGIGKDASQFELLVQKHNTQDVSQRCEYVFCNDLKAATLAAKRLSDTALNDSNYQQAVVLLSPACASIDMFKNYQDRGDQFAHYVNEWVA